jgi:glycosyltransferase involved in cell wall biosynthesis
MTKNTKKLVIILPGLNPGGTERAASELSNYLCQKKRVEVYLLLMYNTPLFYKLDDKVNVLMPAAGMKKKLGKILYIPYMLFFLRKNIKKTQSKHVLCLGYILFSLFAALGLKTKVIVSFRCNPYIKRFGDHKVLNKIYHKLHKLLSFRVDSFIAQTNEAKSFYANRYNCPIAVIPNFLKSTRYSNSVQKKNRIVFLGRLAHVKNPVALLEAYSRIEDKKDWQLHFIGDGVLKTELKKMIHHLGLSDRVILHGFVKNVDAILSESKILGLTSKSEGFPNAIIEAMANKMAVIAYDCKVGPSDIIKDGNNGFLIPPDDVNKLKEKLKLLMDEPKHLERISQKAYTESKQYEIKKIGERYFNFIFDQ